MEKLVTRVRDPEATKARILAAATEEFAAKGISGARIDDIAERARTNKRMLYYYFGSKEGLFREILQRRLDQGIASHRDHETLAPGRLSSQPLEGLCCSRIKMSSSRGRLLSRRPACRNGNAHVG